MAVLVYCYGEAVVLLFCCFWFQVWMTTKYCQQMLITFHQLSHYYNLTYYLLLTIKNENYVYSNYKRERYPFRISFSTTILNYTWKVIRITRVIYDHELQSFQDRTSSCTLRYVDIYWLDMYYMYYI